MKIETVSFSLKFLHGNAMWAICVPRSGHISLIFDTKFDAFYKVQIDRFVSIVNIYVDSVHRLQVLAAGTKTLVNDSFLPNPPLEFKLTS